MQPFIKNFYSITKEEILSTFKNLFSQFQGISFSFEDSLHKGFPYCITQDNNQYLLHIIEESKDSNELYHFSYNIEKIENVSHIDFFQELNKLSHKRTSTISDFLSGLTNESLFKSSIAQVNFLNKGYFFNLKSHPHVHFLTVNNLTYGLINDKFTLVGNFSPKIIEIFSMHSSDSQFQPGDVVAFNLLKHSELSNLRFNVLCPANHGIVTCLTLDKSNQSYHVSIPENVLKKVQ